MGSLHFFQTCTKSYACAASHLLPSHQIPLPKHFHSLSSNALHNPKSSLDSLSLTMRTTPKQPGSPTQFSSMASNGKRITSTGRTVQSTARARQPEIYPSAQLAQLPGMGFNCMPSLPIISAPFKFLTKLNLISFSF